jgi:hypothetical protein
MLNLEQQINTSNIFGSLEEGDGTTTTSTTTTTITRRTRVSFECHTDLLFDDLMGDDDDDDELELEQMDCELFKLLGQFMGGSSSKDR